MMILAHHQDINKIHQHHLHQVLKSKVVVVKLNEKEHVVETIAMNRIVTRKNMTEVMKKQKDLKQIPKKKRLRRRVR